MLHSRPEPPKRSFMVTAAFVTSGSLRPNVRAARLLTQAARNPPSIGWAKPLILCRLAQRVVIHKSVAEIPAIGVETRL